MTTLRISCAALVLSLAAAMPGLAQTTSSGSGTATQSPLATGNLSTGKPVSSVTAPSLPTRDQAQDGQTYLAKTYDDWQERCRKTAKGTDPCVIYQLLKDSTGNPTAEISIFSVPKNASAAAGATVVAPLDTLLTRGLGMAIKGVPNKVYSFLFCNGNGCYSRFGFTDKELAALKQGTSCTVVIYPAQAPGKPVDLTASLKGFTAAYAALEKRQSKP